MVDETKNCENGLTMNICLSYGSRGEIVNACKSLAMDAEEGNLQAKDISELHISQKLLTSHCVDPDVLIRTSGEYRLSNFLLWQLAYTEMFFVPKQWPELQKSDLLHVIRTYANGRRRRFGK
jgi:undecaprenyl diphosphate synthase